MTVNREAQIRDYLAQNLSFISDDLVLVEKEFRLENAYGTRGYIDILAKDRFGNFVVIEIKRSNQAARQAIHEVFKYASLLKQNFSARESELRIVIISTEWSELLAPFSEFCKQTQYPVDGFQIFLDENYLPTHKTTIQPVRDSSNRELAPIHVAYLYEDEGRQRSTIHDIYDRLVKIGIHDFVIIRMCPEELEDKYIYPYVSYVAFQRQTVAIYRQLITKLNPDSSDEIDLYEANSQSDAELKCSLEEKLLSSMGWGFYDDIEIGYPEKFYSHIEGGKWQVTEIIRSGFLASDPRLTDEAIIDEVKGVKGSSSTHYDHYSSSRSRARITEMNQMALDCLSDRPVWSKDVKSVFSKLVEHQTEFDISINIYNPSISVLVTLHRMYSHTLYQADTPLAFLPYYILQIVDLDEEKTSEVHIGQVFWNGEKPSFHEYMLKIFKGNTRNLSLNAAGLSIPGIEARTMQFLGLEYKSESLVISSRETLSRAPNSLTLLDFITECDEFMHYLDQLFRSVTLVI